MLAIFYDSSLYDVELEAEDDPNVENENGEQEDMTETCFSECCGSQHDKPYQPTINFSSTRRIQGKQARSFNAVWFKEHKWLTFCIPRNRVFCFYCRFAFSKGLLTFSKNASHSFLTKGFNNWKKAKEKFREHKQCHAHSEACIKVTAFKQPSIVDPVE